MEGGGGAPKLFCGLPSCCAIGTAECERGFSQMNLVSTDLRNALNVVTISNLLFVKLNGPPLDLWKPNTYALNWLRSHNAAEQNASRTNVDVEEISENDQAFYRVFN